MPKPAPLTGPEAAKQTLAHRLTPIADRLRQLNTRFGLRAQRVFLVWTEWTGAERGEGEEKLLVELELLPTPRHTDFGAVGRRPYSAGIFSEGSVRIDQISAGAYTSDILMGLTIPLKTTTAPRADRGADVNSPDGIEKRSNKRIDFWWEIQEDGRGDSPAARQRYRVYGSPNRDEGKLYFSVNLERADEARNRLGTSTQIGVNASELGIEDILGQSG